MESFNPESPLKPDFQKEYNIILFGETGAGKSTLINYLTNYFKNGTPGNFKIAIPTKHHAATEGLEHHEENVQDATKSQTRACTEYNFSKQDTIFNFIDTPGLSDTEGPEQDDFNVRQIMGAAEQSGMLTSIILVINGTQARATVTLRNTLCLLRSSIPDVLLQNLVVVLTNCSVTTVNFDLVHLKPWTVPESNVFHMNNCAFSRPVSQWAKNERTKKNMEMEWECSMETIKQLTHNLTQLGRKATEAFKQMRINRDRIKSQLHSILSEVKQVQDLQNALDIMKTTQQHISTDIEKYSDYKRTKQVEYTEWVRCAYYSTICTKCWKLCNECWAHIKSPKALFRSRRRSTPIISGIMIFYNATFGGNCQCGHPPYNHFDDNIKSVKKTKTVEEILEDIKNAYDDSVSKNEQIQSKIGGLDADIVALRHALDAKEAEILRCCHELKKLCSQFNFVDELQSVIDVMERDARTLTSTVARVDAENRIRSIKQLVDTLSSAGKSD
ncbi:hypothetical protein RP20_CCG008991 [Aedes albopictus]|nr:uncharacterized protein LOC115267189 [Aedes albopictus]KXJ76726.1 hypothetical protein RP20_CCG008991 [Aedes albopictus]